MKPSFKPCDFPVAHRLLLQLAKRMKVLSFKFQRNLFSPRSKILLSKITERVILDKTYTSFGKQETLTLSFLRKSISDICLLVKYSIRFMNESFEFEYEASLPDSYSNLNLKLCFKFLFIFQLEFKTSIPNSYLNSHLELRIRVQITSQKSLLPSFCFASVIQSFAS